MYFSVKSSPKLLHFQILNYRYGHNNAQNCINIFKDTFHLDTNFDHIYRCTEIDRLLNIFILIETVFLVLITPYPHYYDTLYKK